MYAPGIQYRGDQALLQGGVQSGQNALALLDFFTKQGDRKKEELQLSKAADTFFKTESGATMLKQAGIMPEDFATRSASDKIGIFKGVQESVAMRGVQQQLERGLAEWQAQQQENSANAAFDTAQSKAVGQTLSAALNQRQGPIKPEPVPLEALMQEIVQTPGAGRSRAGSALLQQMVSERGQAKGPVMPVATKVGGRDLIVNPASGSFQDVTPAPAPQMPEGFVPIAATEDENGRLQIRYGMPKAEGKALTQSEVSGIAALNQAEMDLDVLEKIYTELGEGYGGPVSARVKSLAMGGQNPNIAALENAITAATPNLARGVFREVGVLTDQDVARYKQLLPAPTDTQEVRTRKIKQLRDRIAQGRKEMVTSLKTAGRDVEGFDTGADVGSRFDSEAAARSSGAKAGDVIELYDPATATYRKARLK